MRRADLLLFFFPLTACTSPSAPGRAEAQLSAQGALLAGLAPDGLLVRSIRVDDEDVASVLPVGEGAREAVEVLPPEGLVLASVVVDRGGGVVVEPLLGGSVGVGHVLAVGAGGEGDELVVQG